jgi:hypothetical protein
MMRATAMLKKAKLRMSLTALTLTSLESQSP